MWQYECEHATVIIQSTHPDLAEHGILVAHFVDIHNDANDLLPDLL